MLRSSAARVEHCELTDGKLVVVLRHVAKSLKALMGNVGPAEDVEMAEDDLEEMVCHALFASDITTNFDN